MKWPLSFSHRAARTVDEIKEVLAVAKRMDKLCSNTDDLVLLQTRNMVHANLECYVQVYLEMLLTLVPKEKKMKWTKSIEMPQGDKKTKSYEILTLDEILLGTVRFYPAWRKFVFAPAANTLYEEVCLRDIADFCEEKTKAWKLEVKARKG